MLNGESGKGDTFRVLPSYNEGYERIFKMRKKPVKKIAKKPIKKIVKKPVKSKLTNEQSRYILLAADDIKESASLINKLLDLFIKIRDSNEFEVEDSSVVDYDVYDSSMRAPKEDHKCWDILEDLLTYDTTSLTSYEENLRNTLKK